MHSSMDYLPICSKKTKKRNDFSGNRCQFKGSDILLEKTERVNMLYDFYHSLLTEKQKSYMELYYREDYSLGEIADESNVSRQAVYDNIKRTEQLLESYEQKLHLYDKFMKRTKLLSQLETLIKTNENKEKMLRVLEKLQKID